MKLHKFRIQGYRRYYDDNIKCGDATFLIGENNVGKSSVLKALDLFFSNQGAGLHDFLIFDHENNKRVESLTLTATFTDIPPEAKTWKYFKGKIIKEKDGDGIEREKIIYRKTYYLNSNNIKYEMKEYKHTLKEEYKECTNLESLIRVGVKEEDIQEAIPNFKPGSKLSTEKVYNSLKVIDYLWDVDEDTEEWFNNPGGIPGNILVKIPKFLLIPAEDKKSEIDQKAGTLQKTLKELFEDIRNQSSNYQEAQKHLDRLAKEMDPDDPNQDFGKMMNEVNSILKNVFPDSELHINTDLSDPDSSIHPLFDVEMSSNVRTTTDRQGMGTIRSAVFALLRYREEYLERSKSTDDDYVRPLIIGFEEPEIYLHPNAANNMRDEIYNLANSTSSQIIATTHSPYMIDLSKDLEHSSYPIQLLNHIKLTENENVTTTVPHTNPFNITQAYERLKDEERDLLKLVLKMDDYVSRVFFSSEVIIIEGDTEEIVLKESIRRMPEEVRKDILFNYQIIRARGKATIVALIKYLKALSIDPIVIHDKDEKPGAIKFNEPIKNNVSSEERLIVLENCIEDVLGYTPPERDKPYEAYKYIRENWNVSNSWDGVQDNWKEICEKIFKNAFNNQN